MPRAFGRQVFLAALLSLGATAALAHPFHVSLAEAEYNAKDRMLEVALRVHPSDLEEALRRQAGRRIVLEKETESVPQIQNWLRQSLVFKSSSGKVAEIRWVGQEVSVQEAWLYFEVPLPQGLENVEITNRIFFDLLPDQVNTINIRDGQRKLTRHFTRSRPRQQLTLPAP